MFNGHLFWMLLRHIRFADRRNTYVSMNEYNVHACCVFIYEIQYQIQYLIICSCMYDFFFISSLRVFQSLYTNRHRAEGERGNEQNNEGDNNNDDDDDNDEDDDDDDTDDNGNDNDNDDDDDDYYFNNSSNNLSENSDSQSESSDVGRIQCP